MGPAHIETCSLASGSSGNAYLFRTASHSFLIDAGISCRALRERLAAVGTDLATLDGIFITHEHVDHVRGLAQIAKHHRIPLYITGKCLAATSLDWEKSLLCPIRSHTAVRLGSTLVQAGPKPHDAADPCFFTVTHGEKSITVLTDLGAVTPPVCRAITMADALYLECNYDPEMLRRGPYPEFLQARITGGRGHLSNSQAASLLGEFGTARLRHLFLAHLSANNNSPELALDSIRDAVRHNRALAGTTVTVAPRERHSEVFRL